MTTNNIIVAPKILEAEFIEEEIKVQSFEDSLVNERYFVTKEQPAIGNLIDFYV